LFEADPWSASEAPRTTTTLGAFLESSEVAVRARSAADPTLRAQLLLLLGKLYANLGEPAAAVSLAAEVVEVRRAATGRGPELADALDVLGTAQQEAGRYDEAEATFREALALRERGDDQKSLADALTNMATLLHTRERVADLPEAARLQARALTIRRELFGTEHLDTAQALANLAVVQLAQGDVAAESGLREALAIRERLLGADHPLVATTCNNLANLLLEAGVAEPALLEEAEALFRRAIASWSAALGSDHPRVSTGWWGLSHTLEARGDLAGALAAARQTHRIDSQRLPPEHPYLAEGQQRLAELEAKLATANVPAQLAGDTP
jgi:tetratricopeptide (TPR) repeat protein